MKQEKDKRVNDPTSEKRAQVPVSDPHREESDVPLFLRDGSEDHQYDAQDEKDKSAE